MKSYWVALLALSMREAFGAPLPPPEAQPMPVFLRMGFSSVLEFEEAPTRVVLGDSQAFQVERLDQSLVLRTLAAYANTNMFVYFKSAPQRLFVLTASEEVEPTYFRKVEPVKPPLVVAPKAAPSVQNGPRTIAVVARGKSTGVVSAVFDPKKDFLTVEVLISAGSDTLVRPAWDKVRLRHQTQFKTPHKLWAERKEVQKDAAIRSRFIFAKPNVPRDLSDTAIIIPIEGRSDPIVLGLKRGTR